MKNFLKYLLTLILLVKSIAFANENSLILEFKEEKLNRELEDFKKWQNGIELQTLEEKVFESSTQNCFFVNEIIFEGNKIYSQKRLLNQVKKFLNKNICGNGILELTSVLNKFYIKNGYITTQSYVKPQNISSGKVIISIIEGEIEYVDFAENSFKNRLTNFMINPAKQGKNTNIKDIDQLTENLQSLQSFDFKTELDAGSKNGLTRLKIKGRQKFPIIFSANLDNTGAKNTGKWKKSFGLTEENLLGIGEEIHTKYNFSKGESGKTNTSSIGGSFAFRYLKFNHDFSVSKYENKVKSGNIFFISSGKTQINATGLNYVLIRKTALKSSLIATLNTTDSKSYINDALSKVQSRKLSNVEVGLSNNFYSRFGSLLFKATYTKGLDFLTTIKDKQGLQREDPQAQFWLVSSYLLYNTRLPFQIGYSLTFSGQYAKTELYSQNQFSIGGLGSVRGYEISASGSSGFFVRNEVSKDFLRFFKVGIFGDYGNSYSYVYETDRLSSYGAFLEFRYKTFANTKITIAQPVLNKMEEKTKIYLNVGINF